MTGPDTDNSRARPLNKKHTDMTKKYIPILTIAGSDSSGGAGIQADIKTMSALGCYAASAITSITVQNTTGVTAVEALRPEIVAGQIKAVMDDIHPKSVKIGMVNDTATITAIAEELRRHNEPDYLVIDPVMVSTSGSRLMQEDALETFRRELMPLATLLTPNIPEAEVLSGVRISDDTSCDAAARVIAKAMKTGGYMLIKGGHTGGNEKQDRLYDSSGLFVTAFTQHAIDTCNTHGTGCTLSSAVTCYLAMGMHMEEAIGKAKEYVSMAIAAGADVSIGGEHGPVNHFFCPEPMRKTR